MNPITPYEFVLLVLLPQNTSLKSKEFEEVKAQFCKDHLNVCCERWIARHSVVLRLNGIGRDL